MIRTVRFDQPAFDQPNTVQFNTLNMLVTDVYVRFDLGAIPTTPGLKLEPTTTWIGPGGVIFGQHEAVMYQCQQEELITYYYDNPGTFNDFTDQMVAHNDWAYTPAGFSGKRSGGQEGGSTGGFLLKLAPISDKIFSKIGSLNAHQPKSLYLTVNLAKSARIVTASAGTPEPPASEIPIQFMEVILVGHREDRLAVAKYQRALLGDGIRFALEQPNYVSQVVPASQSSAQLSAPSISGDVTYFKFLLRNNDAFTESVNPENSKNLDWITSVLASMDSTLNIGTPESESEVFGKPTPLKILQQAYKGSSIAGSTRFLGPEGELRETAEIPVPMGMDTSAGQTEGVWSGAYRVQNNLVANFAFAPDSGSAAMLINWLVYTRRVILIGANAFSSATE